MDMSSINSSLCKLSLLQRKQPDDFSSLDQVTNALRDAGLESRNLILGIDFTKSNAWTGEVSFNGESLHAIGDTENPYEKAISVIGKTLAPFDDDNSIPCFGFGDSTTHDQKVFSFHNDHSPCHGFEEVLACYKDVVPNLGLSGPTSYGPVIDAAVDIVENSGGQFHVLVIIADGQVNFNPSVSLVSVHICLYVILVLQFSILFSFWLIMKITRSNNPGHEELSSQEARTIKSIVDASSHALSIVLVGVGDGPWEDMKKFHDKIPVRDFDNFQFVNFTEIMSNNKSQSKKEIEFALAALMGIPLQYKATIELGLLGHQTGRARKMVPCPPPLLYASRPQGLDSEPSDISSSTVDVSAQVCPICITNVRDLALGCGHLTCRECGPKVSNCPICRKRITSHLRLFP
ncbi:hypothetical protein SLEP1_g45831 [Rubroshorea leprosula]|uniref:RING-type domain-containing protein n=1 Tax=Rubroshorea leprosula TaxID=152421 RepID=A0AAV5LL41_9ROSI|nr:hypothetical protein SLEP1_g45831 [Rubroshorea leprosula]